MSADQTPDQPQSIRKVVKTVLVVTLLVMGVATFLIGLLPTYAAIGVAAPILLVALRVVQGLGGEWGGAVLMSLEHGQPNRRGWNASWPQVGVPAGNLLAAAVLAIMSAALSDAAFESWTCSRCTPSRS
jgi:MFS family permease